MTSSGEKSSVAPSLFRSRRAVMYGTLPFVAVTMIALTIVLKQQPDLASRIASGVLPRIGWPFGDYHASQIASAGRARAEVDRYIASIAVYGLLWQGWIAVLLVSAAVTVKDAVLSKRWLFTTGGIAFLGLLSTVIPLTAEGSSRRAGYADPIGHLLFRAGVDMSFFYACVAIVLDSFIIWLSAHHRR